MTYAEGPRVKESPPNAVFLFSLSTMDDRSSLYLPTAGARAASVKFLLIIVGRTTGASRRERERARSHSLTQSATHSCAHFARPPERGISQTFLLIGEFK